MSIRLGVGVSADAATLESAINLAKQRNDPTIVAVTEGPYRMPSGKVPYMETLNITSEAGVVAKLIDQRDITFDVGPPPAGRHMNVTWIGWHIEAFRPVWAVYTQFRYENCFIGEVHRDIFWPGARQHPPGNAGNVSFVNCTIYKIHGRPKVGSEGTGPYHGGVHIYPEAESYDMPSNFTFQQCLVMFCSGFGLGHFKAVDANNEGALHDIYINDCLTVGAGGFEADRKCADITIRDSAFGKPANYQDLVRYLDDYHPDRDTIWQIGFRRSTNIELWNIYIEDWMEGSIPILIDTDAATSYRMKDEVTTHNCVLNAHRNCQIWYDETTTILNSNHGHFLIKDYDLWPEGLKKIMSGFQCSALDDIDIDVEPGTSVEFDEVLGPSIDDWKTYAETVWFAAMTHGVGPLTEHVGCEWVRVYRPGIAPPVEPPIEPMQEIYLSATSPGGLDGSSPQTAARDFAEVEIAEPQVAVHVRVQRPSQPQGMTPVDMTRDISQSMITDLTIGHWRSASDPMDTTAAITGTISIAQGQHVIVDGAMEPTSNFKILEVEPVEPPAGECGCEEQLDQINTKLDAALAMLERLVNRRRHVITGVAEVQEADNV